MNITKIETPISSAQQTTISVLTPFEPWLNTVKRFQLDEAGAVTCIAYDSASSFNHQRTPVRNFDEYVTLLNQLSRRQNALIIRGQAKHGLHQVASKKMVNFPEPSEGCQWVMIDFDNLPLPEQMRPVSREALEYCIGQLPGEFQTASYFFQHSSSAGIVEADGTPYRNKSGLNAHVWFWLDRRVSSELLSAYLQGHCIDTGFYQKTRTKRDVPMIRYGVDLSVIKTSVQPNYIGLPIIAAGVRCTLASDQRQGIVRKNNDAVVLPAFEQNLSQSVRTKHKQLRDAYCRECGMVKARSVTTMPGSGVAVSTHFVNPNGSAAIRVGREFQSAVPYGQGGDAIILYFADEGSPGSWHVQKSSPQFAFRFGDHECLHLQELSQGAYEYVRDTMGWFSEIPHLRLPLTSDGFLPRLASFTAAKVSLIFAPTGSGKTTAFRGYAVEKRTKIIFYAAPTISLCKQTTADLRRGGVTVRYYQDYRGERIEPGVYVTTYKSLSKFVCAAEQQMADFELVLDEIHGGIDESMQSPWAQKQFEAAIARAAKIMMLTATATSLQQKKIIETIGFKRGALTRDNFAIYEFQPVKSNPLFICDIDKFGGDLTCMFGRYQAMHERGEEIPRTVIMVPESKMRRYQILLESYKLETQAYMVSRPEASEEEIEQARTGNLPILISSPLFALGMNFEFEPKYLFAYFDGIDADETQIVQTLNRANRGETACEVRLYAGERNTSPIIISSQLQEKMKEQIANYYREEASLEGLLDISSVRLKTE